MNDETYKSIAKLVVVFVDNNEQQRYNVQQQQNAPTLLLCIFTCFPILGRHKTKEEDIV